MPRLCCCCCCQPIAAAAVVPLPDMRRQEAQALEAFAAAQVDQSRRVVPVLCCCCEPIAAAAAPAPLP